MMVVVLCILFGATYWVAQTSILTGFKKIEIQKMEDNLKRLEKAYHFDLENMSVKVADWAFWDDTYQFVEDHNKEYIESNLGADSIANLQIEYMFFLNPAGQIVFQRALDNEKKELTPVPPDLKKIINENPTFINLTDNQKKIHGLLNVNEELFIFAARPILTSSAEGPARGTLVFAKKLDSSLLGQLSDVIQSSILLKKDTTLPLVELDENAITGRVPLKNIGGNTVAVMEITYPTEIIQQGRWGIAYFMAMFGLIGVAAMTLLILFTDSLSVSKTEKLAKEISQIGQSGSLDSRVTVSGNDEVTVLAKNINSTLQTLQQTQSLLRESQIRSGLGSYVLDIPSGKWTGSEVLNQVFGIDEKFELTVAGWATLVHPDDRQKMIDYYREEVIGKNKPFDQEYRIIRPSDKAVRWVHGTGTLETGADGKPSKMYGIIHDITKQKTSEETLRFKVDELERINKLTVNRELKMAEMKKELEKLKKEGGK
jgi:PAS domain S-box-containing protein